MTDRISVYSDVATHRNPIPSACRIGNLVMSSIVVGTHTSSGEPVDTLEAQCRVMFERVAEVIRAAGGTPADIIKVTVRMRDRSQRAALNPPWLALFPDPGSRPARHTESSNLDGAALVECDFVAVIRN